MNLSLEVDHLSKGEKIGFVLSACGVLILLALTIKSSLETGVVPDIEQKIFGGVFIFTLILIGSVLISHYTSTVQSIQKKLRKLQ